MAPIRRRAGSDDLIEIDMADLPWPVILQDIVCRSPTLDEITVLEWFNDLSQRPESFGARMMLITATGILEKTSIQIFDEFRRPTLKPLGPGS